MKNKPDLTPPARPERSRAPATDPRFHDPKAADRRIAVARTGAMQRVRAGRPHPST